MERTDIHRPAVADPAEYEEVAYIDLHPDEGGTWWDRSYQGETDNFADTPHTEYNQCQHCGHHRLRYLVIFLHRPSGKLLQVGQQCASKLSMPSRQAAVAKRDIERQALQRKRDAFREANPEVCRFLADYSVEHTEGKRKFNDFLSSLDGQLMRKGELSERQVEAVKKFIDREKEWEAQRAEEKADEPDPSPVPITDERVQITGKILSVKFQDSIYGPQEKMLVMDDRGFKVWGTRPQSLLVRVDNEDLGWIEQDGHRHRPADKGDRVQFVAKVKPSDDDETFGFFSRPAQAQVIDNIQLEIKEPPNAES